MPQKPVRRSKEEYQYSVNEARKRWKINERKMKELFKSDKAQAMQTQQNKLMAEPCTMPEADVKPCENVMVAVIIVPHEMVTMTVMSSVEETVHDTSDTIGHVVREDFIEDVMVPTMTSTEETIPEAYETATEMVCEGFIRGDVSYAKFYGSDGDNIFKAYETAFE